MWFGDLVTMRWWDDLWLNESFATWAAVLAAGRGHPVARRLDHVLPAAEGLGLPAGPAAVDAPDRGRHPGHRRRRGQLRRHHLRQGRGGAQAARRLRRPGQFLAGVRLLLRPARLGQRHPDRPAGRAAGGLRPGTVRLVQAVAGNGRGEHAAARVPVRRRGRVDRVRGGAERAGRAIRCSARTASPSASTTGPAAGLAGGAGSRPTSRASARCSPSWPASAGPTWCWSTTTTSPTPRSGWTSTRWPR